MENVKRTKKMWGNGVSCSETAKLQNVIKAEVGTCLWPWVRWKKANAKLCDTGISHFLNYTYIFWPARVCGMTKRQKTQCRNSWKAGQWPFLTKAYQSRSHNMTSDLIYMATGWTSSFIQASTCCNKEIFLKNSLNTLYTHSVLTFLTCYINTLA